MADVELERIAAYYTEKLRQYGPVPRGVDWNSEISQTLRFEQLLRLTNDRTAFSINEIGCGYGAFVQWLEQKGISCEYHGVDVSVEMIGAARSLNSSNRATFAAGSIPDVPRDYCVSSGIFNVRLLASDEAWREYILETLNLMNEFGRSGFAFNVLTRYSDAEKMRENLYYADPLFLFDHCKRAFSRNVALLHDYGLYEFTILVRKDAG